MKKKKKERKVIEKQTINLQKANLFEAYKLRLVLLTNNRKSLGKCDI